MGMINFGRQAVAGMYFVLSIDGTELPCKSIQSMEEEQEYDYIQEGGKNDGVHIVKKPLTKPLSLKIERYVGDQFRDPLKLGTALVSPLVLKVGNRQAEQDGRITEPVLQFAFGGCQVTGKSYGGFDAEKTGLLVQTTTVIYQELNITQGEEIIDRFGGADAAKQSMR